jgi:hypothetical protein
MRRHVPDALTLYKQLLGIPTDVTPAAVQLGRDRLRGEVASLLSSPPALLN